MFSGAESKRVVPPAVVQDAARVDHQLIVLPFHVLGQVGEALMAPSFCKKQEISR